MGHSGLLELRRWVKSIGKPRQLELTRHRGKREEEASQRQDSGDFRKIPIEH